MGALRLLMAAVLVGAGAVGVAAERAPQAELHGLGSLGGGGFESRAYAVSANGRVVVGYSKTPAGTEAFRWTPEEGMVGLGFLSSTDSESIARDVSADGRVVVGRTRYEGSAQNVYEAFRWTAGGGMEGLGFLPEGSRSEACGVSATGHVVVGEAGTRGRYAPMAFRWTRRTGMQPLGHPPGREALSRTNACSASGLVAVGWTEAMDAGEASEGFRWMPRYGMRGIGDLPGGDFYSVANDVSASGGVIVGNSLSGPGRLEGFRWKMGRGMQPLGILGMNPYTTGSNAQAVSADGRVVVGYYSDAERWHTFIWTEADGIRDFEEVLVEDHGLDLAGWKLEQAYDISADGRTIVGQGRNPTGVREAWRVVLPRGRPRPRPTPGKGWRDYCKPYMMWPRSRGR